MSEEIREPDLAAVEAALAGLAPAPGGVSRDQVLFRAGQASVRRGWGWPCATGVMTCVAAVLGVALLLRPVPQGAHSTHYVLIPAPSLESFPVAPAPTVAREDPLPPEETEEEMPRLQISYFKLQDQVLRWGVDALPRPPAPATDHQPLNLRQLLGEPPAPPDTPSWFPWKQFFERGERS
jgi:hypothetical protein